MTGPWSSAITCSGSLIREKPEGVVVWPTAPSGYIMDLVVDGIFLSIGSVPDSKTYAEDRVES